MLVVNHMVGFGESFVSSASVDVADVFSTDLWTGTSAVRSITNGIDLSGEGGTVWIKERSAALGNESHAIFDTERGALKRLKSDANDAEANHTVTLTGFNADGFDLGTDGDFAAVNYTGATYVGWSCRQAAGFHNIVKFIGNGSNRTISHNLGATPGMIIIKNLDQTDAWKIYHRSNTGAPETDYMEFDTGATTDDATVWNDTAPTDAVFSVGTHVAVNTNTENYVAYLFGHDPDGIIQCGSYTGNGSASGPTVNLGWDPQFVMIKDTTGTGNHWIMVDSARGISAGNEPMLGANAATAESSFGSLDVLDLTGTGFQIATANSNLNTNSSTYIYMAIKAA